MWLRVKEKENKTIMKLFSRQQLISDANKFCDIKLRFEIYDVIIT